MMEYFLLLTSGAVILSFILDSDLINEAVYSRLKWSSFKRSIVYTILWIVLALIFNILILLEYGRDTAIEFFTAYLLEKGLSIDNVFVFYAVFNSLSIPQEFQQRVLKWGIFGALIMRALFIITGISLLQRFHFLIYALGILLVITGVKLLRESIKGTSDNQDFLDSWWMRIVRVYIPFSDQTGEGDFIIITTQADGTSTWFATKILLALIVIEILDALFAIDSLSAILAVTKNPLIVCTSNVFAILGLRALYFSIEGLVQLFEYLKHGLSVILIFTGIKILGSGFFQIPLYLTLLLLIFIFAIVIVVSIHKKMTKQQDIEISPVDVITE